MSLFLDGPLPLEDTISFVQQVPLPSNNKLTQMFPQKSYSTDEIDFSTITQTNRSAKFRNWDGSYWVSPRDTGQERRIRLMALGGQLGVGEYERRQQQYAMYGGSIQSVLTDAIYNDLELLTRYVQNRIELAWGDVLADGVLTINENGVQQQLDFGIPAAQLVTPAGALWSDTTNSNPLTDMIAWYDIYRYKNGMGPGKILLSLTTARQLMANKNLINQIRGAQTGVTNVTLEEISGLFASWGLPPITMMNPANQMANGAPMGAVAGQWDSVYESYIDVDGTSTPPLPANKLLFLPADLSTLGFTAWGTPTTVMELNANNVQVQSAAGIIGILVREDQPPFQKRTFVDAVALPVLADPRKLLVATVG